MNRPRDQIVTIVAAATNTRPIVVKRAFDATHEIVQPGEMLDMDAREDTDLVIGLAAVEEAEA